ncbi:MAG: cyclohexanecarboxylate-CoA ligase [Candidatus Rokuibacteriota bacterium]|nr:MAG: cyclohexanecarboxylate-CoA ligase [Candidatus Rokubacteria bacterium]
MAIRDIYHDADTIQRSVQAGAWSNTTLDDYLQQHARERGDKLAIVDRAWRLTFAELDRLARRVAGGLLRLGLTPGDVISIQTPNWAEWLIMHCAATKIGAVTNSIGAMYRHREVSYILDYAETALMLIPDAFRGFSYTAMLAELWPKLGNLRHVLVIGDHVPRGMLSFRELLETAGDDGSPGDLAPLRPDPNGVATLMFTSGTEANPKGVMHTHNTLGLASRHVKEIYGLSTDDVVFMASPIGHTTALIVGARLPVMYGMTTVWQEHWNPEAAVELIAREGCTCTVSATPFLHGLVHAPNGNRDTLKTFRLFACGGAPVPRDLIRRAEDEHGFLVSALYGSSEALVNSAITRADGLDKRYATDGKILPDVEARLVDPDTGAPRKPGEEGELQVRTPALFAGYYKDPARTREVCSPDRWYSTGDLCTLDADNYVSVVGRKKDMIIRGGANISAREIEELLFTHPKVAGVACVAMPDPVLAERVCAFVICPPGDPLTFDEMIAFLKDQRMAVWKLPERLEVRAAFPMTPSGKIQKYLLREEIARLLGQKALIR